MQSFQYSQRFKRVAEQGSYVSLLHSPHAVRACSCCEWEQDDLAPSFLNPAPTGHPDGRDYASDAQLLRKGARRAISDAHST